MAGPVGLFRNGRTQGRPQKDVSRTLARSEGTVVAVISERCRSPANVTVRVSGALCVVLAVKPWFGTAEMRHTPPLP